MDEESMRSVRQLCKFLNCETITLQSKTFYML